jgi:hypothetical protein
LANSGHQCGVHVGHNKPLELSRRLRLEQEQPALDGAESDSDEGFRHGDSFNR